MSDIIYFCAYVSHDGDGPLVGNATLGASREIKSDEDIRTIEDALQKNGSTLGKVTLINIQRLDRL